MENKLELKQLLYFQCVEFCNNRLLNIQKTIEEIQESLTSETKSSAGDKHETGRAMLQLEREKAGNQLAEIQKLQEALSKIDVTKTNKVIGLGSVVYTTQANYFIAISAGELKLNNQAFYAISPNTPIGKLLIGNQVDDTIIFRNFSFDIINVQ
ncbi:3-oxoacyl-ACP synthase [Xanthomarina sp. F2636L]|uniref:3-oxoacyl-ACP synthase n=1 Tax=Xanthomarina sp. F2636L TaxID=2996018 RepID=UPI00225E3E65|nr:3-oxoacyl-ACP synthase [Xanthomarina sp. F2636L]MCX7551243.1 3-oxoacyl-ACP synthase [Xanthomarina sp. F2636L]